MCPLSKGKKLTRQVFCQVLLLSFPPTTFSTQPRGAWGGGGSRKTPVENRLMHATHTEKTCITFCISTFITLKVIHFFLPKGCQGHVPTVKRQEADPAGFLPGLASELPSHNFQYSTAFPSTRPYLAYGSMKNTCALRENRAGGCGNLKGA